MTGLAPARAAATAVANPGDLVPVAVPELAGNEWTYVKECLDSGWVSSVGPFVAQFETEFAARIGVRHAVAMASGTAALHVGLQVAGVRPDDEVLMPALTFVAPANAVRYAGAWPVFVDAEPETWQMDVVRAVQFLERGCRRAGRQLWNRATGRRIGAVLPVHVLGHPVDLEPLLHAVDGLDLPVVEDAAEALGAVYRGRGVGSFGLTGCFSFNGNKVMTTGGGGMLVTDDDALAERARYLSTTAKIDAVEGVHGEVGYNYRLTNLQAAVGCAQLERLDGLLAAKRRIAQRYAAGLDGIPGLSPMPEAPWARSAFWLYTVRVDGAESDADARALRRRLRAAGVDSRLFWQPLHRSPAHAGAQVLGGAVAERLHGELLSLPCSCGLGEAAQERVVEAVRESLGA